MQRLSRQFADALKWAARFRAALALVGVFVLYAHDSAGQEPSELGNLIFEPVPLASAGELPFDVDPAPGDDTQALSATVDEQLAAIEALREARRRDPALIDHLGSLAVAYQGLGRHEEALEALDEAISLSRREHGRNGLEQVTLLEQTIPSYFALGDLGSIDDTEERVYALKERHFDPGSREMYYATINLADWLTSAFYRENFSPAQRIWSGNMGEGAALGCTGVTDPILPVLPACRARLWPMNVVMQAGPVFDEFDPYRGASFAEDYVDQSRLRAIDGLYSSFQSDFNGRENDELDIVVELSKRVTGLGYTVKQGIEFDLEKAVRPRFEPRRQQTATERLQDGYTSGNDVLRQVIDLSGTIATLPPEALAAAWLDLGDWQLAFGKKADAEDAYGQAYQVLIDAGFPSAGIDAALAVPLPPRIPLFATHLYTRRSVGIAEDTELRFRGYVDVSFIVDGSGNAGDVRFLGGSAEDSANIERLLVRELGSSRFRPALVGGRLSSPGQVEARYFYAY